MMQPFHIPTGLDRLQQFDERAPKYGWVASYGDGGLRWRDLVSGEILTHHDDASTEGIASVQSSGSANGLVVDQDCSSGKPSYATAGLDMPNEDWTLDFATKFSFLSGAVRAYFAGTSNVSSRIAMTSTSFLITNNWSAATITMPGGWDSDEWHRYTLKCSGFATYTLWLDGVEVDTQTAGGSPFPWQNIESLFGLVSLGTNKTSVNGQLAYFNLYDRLLASPPDGPLGWLKRRTKPRTHLTFRPQLLTANKS